MKNKDWDGCGLPPVGAVCEYYWSEGDEWRKCEVVAYYLSNVVAVDVIDSSAVCLHFGLGLFRPVRTPEQIAEEERLQAIDEMLGVGDWRGSIYKDVMSALYDAGYRRTGEEKCLTTDKPLITTDKPLTVEELKAGDWRCDDVSKDCANAFEAKGLRVFNSGGWGLEGTWGCCVIADCGEVMRAAYGLERNKQIHRIGSDFYWSDV